MNACVRFAPLLGSRPGELPAAEERALRDHLAGCDACRARLADAQAIGALLAEALSREADRRDFSAFSDQVLARVSPGGFWAWFRRHRRAAIASLIAPAVAAAAVALYVAIESRPEADEVAWVEVQAGPGATILQTHDGPIVLIGSSDSEGT